MKVGDKVKVIKSGTIFEIVRMGFSDDVALMSDSMLFTCSVTRVKDYKNITEAEFLELCRDKCTNLDGSELFPKRTYRYGDIFVITESKYRENVGVRLMLCQTDPCRYCLIALTGAERGNRWVTPFKVDFGYGIHESDVLEMLGGAKDYTKIEVIENV